MKSGPRLLLWIVPVLLLAAASSAPAQVLAPGTRVRVTADDARTVGRVDRSTADTLALLLPEGQRTVLPWSGIERIEYSPGRKSNVGRGALIGAGAMAALTVASVAFDDSDEGGEDWTGVLLLVAVPLNAGIGAGLGALVGLAWRTERWETLPVGPGAVGGRGAPEARLTIRF